MGDASDNAQGHCRTAQIDWTDDGQPLSRDFDDLYFSHDDGLAETRHVFLTQNRLAERWTGLEENEPFVLGETGFGTGLNFLAAWRLWRETAPATARLHFLSVEAYPLTPEDLRRALAAWAELSDEAQALIEAYPTCLTPGMHHLVFDQGRVRLTLALDEAVAGLDAFLQSSHPAHRTPMRGVDAWFLDGFAPARNPAMWRPELFAAVEALSAPGATFATFTAAGDVRRGLEAAGFAVRRKPGFGRKRDMLTGQRNRPPGRPSADAYPASPYPDGQPHAWHVHTPAGGRRAAVIGGGLAGCHAAAALARRNFDVTLLEAEAALACGGSGNDQGVLYAKPSPRGGLASDFNLAALLFAQRHYRRFWTQGEADFGEACGVLHVATSDQEADAQAALVLRLGNPALCRRLDRAEASAIAGVALPRGGLWFPDSGWLAPRAICRALVESSIETPITARQARIERLERNASGAWALLDDRGEVHAEANHVVLACATGLPAFRQTETLKVQPVRGQVSALPTAQAGQAANLRVALCADGYVAPSGKGPAGEAVCFGASFAPDDAATDTRTADHADNLARLRRSFPALVPDEVRPSDCSGRAALRCATPDRLPMAGPVPDIEVMSERFALLRKNARAAIAAAGAWQNGLYVSVGYGSRGLAYIPLASEWLAAQITGEPPPLAPALRIGLNPARFLVRDLKRRRA